MMEWTAVRMSPMSRSRENRASIKSHKGKRMSALSKSREDKVSDKKP